MTNISQKIVTKAWNFSHVLRDDGLSCMAWTEPDILAREIIDDLEDALAQLRSVASELR